MKLDRLKADYGRYLAIEERRKIDANHALLEHFELVDEFVAALPGLLRVCDAYVADAREPDCMGREEIQCPPSRDCRDCAKIQAEKKLWELLG